MKSTEGPFLDQGKPEVIPLHLQQGCIPSDGEREVIEVDPSQEWVSLNFIGAATFKTIVFSIDAHKMWVYEVDGDYIEPQRVDTIHMYVGERYSVMVKLDQPARDYTIRVADNCLTQVITEYATLRYKGSTEHTDTEGVLSYGGQNITDVVTLDREHLPPYPANPPGKQSDAFHVLHTHRWGSPWKYTMSGGGMYQEDRSAYAPLLFDPHSVDALNESLVIRTKNGTWVDMVIQVGSLPDQPQEFPHMMHKHSNKMWKIGAGEGKWNYSSVDEAIATEPHRFNLENPMYRDTYITSFDGPAWLVLRYQVTNPGPWLFHCHIETHLAGGMAVAILDGIDAWPEIPPEYAPDQRGHEIGVLPELAAGNPQISTDAHVKCSPRPQISNDELGKSAYWRTLVLKTIGFLETLVSDA